MSETAIRALEQKLTDQDRALIEISKRQKIRATIKQNNNNEWIQLRTNQNSEQEYMVWKCMIWNIQGWGGTQDKINKRMRKKIKRIKSEIEGYGVIILIETHLSKEEEKINKME